MARASSVGTAIRRPFTNFFRPLSASHARQAHCLNHLLVPAAARTPSNVPVPPRIPLLSMDLSGPLPSPQANIRQIRCKSTIYVVPSRLPRGQNSPRLMFVGLRALLSNMQFSFADGKVGGCKQECHLDHHGNPPRCSTFPCTHPRRTRFSSHPRLVQP